MFSLRKLERLPPRTRLRKLLVMIRDEEQRRITGAASQGFELRCLLGSEAFLSALGAGLRDEAARNVGRLAGDSDGVVRALNGLRHTILAELGVPWAEWDQLLPGATAAEAASRRTYPMRVFLEDVRSPYNVGAIFRSAEAFGAEHVYLSPRTPSPDLPRARRTSRGCSDVVSWSICDLEGLSGEALPVFALETGGTDLDRFPFPRSGTVLIGSEELGLSPEALALAEAGGGRVSIPMTGSRASLNVAVAFGILMRAWYSRLAG